MTSQETSRYLKSIFEDLHQAIRTWHVYKEMNDHVCQRPFGYIEFIETVCTALLDSVIMACSRPVDHRRGTLSLRKLLEQLDKNSEENEQLKSWLTANNGTLETLKQVRNEFIAHSASRKTQPVNLISSDLEKITTSLEEELRQLGSIIQQADYDFDSDKEAIQRETGRVMEILWNAWLVESQQ